MPAEFSSDQQTITRFLKAWGDGNQHAFENLVRLIEPELRKIARKSTRDESRHDAMTTTTLLQEAYTSLLKKQDIAFEDRKHFYRFAARLMRHILVDEARKKLTDKRHGEQLPLRDDELLDEAHRPHHLIHLEELLEGLAEIDPEAVRVFEMRFFAGFTLKETAGHLDYPKIKVDRKWKIARSWLYGRLKGEIVE